MLSRTATTTNATRKGGPRSRSHNDDRFKGTVTGVVIPEAPRGSDGIEDFENLLDSGLDTNKPSQQARNFRNKSPNGFSKAPNSASSKNPLEERDRVLPRSKPPSALGPSMSRSIRSVDVEYSSVPSPRVNTGRLAPALSPATGYRRPSPGQDPSISLGFPPPRASQTFGALSRYQDEQPDAEAVMEQYVDYNGGIQPDEDEATPPPVQTSSPPQPIKKFVPSPLAARIPKKSLAAPNDDDDELNGLLSRQAKGKQRASEEPHDSSPLASRKSNMNGKSRLEEAEEDVNDAISTLKPQTGRGSRSNNELSPSKLTTRSRQSLYAPPPDDIPVHEHYDDPLLNNYDDDVDADATEIVVSPHEEPPRSASERDHSGAESEHDNRTSQKKGKFKEKEKKSVPKSKEKATESKKKRPREEVDEEPQRQKKKPKSTDSRTTGRAKSKEPQVDESYIEELVSPSEDEQEEEEGVRRSRRARIAPVKFWLGERLEYEQYQPGDSRQVPTIIGVRRVPEPVHASLSRRKKKGQTKGRSRSRKLDSEEPQSRAVSIMRDDSGWDDDTEPIGRVLDYETNDEVERMIAFTAAMVVPKLTEKGHFLYQRIFADEKFVAAGQLVIPAKGEKPKKSAKDNTYVFYLIEGVIHVIVHETKFYLSPGGMFMVPRGNHYYIRNMKDYEAKLFFVQGRLMREEDFEESRAGTARPDRSPSRPRRVDEAGRDERRIGSSARDGFDSSSPQKKGNQRGKASGLSRR